MKSQRAMAVAQIYPEASQVRGRGHKVEKVEETSGFSSKLLQQARYVLKHAPGFPKNLRNSAYFLLQVNA